MKGELEYLADLVLLELTREERREVAKRLKALKSVLKRLENVKVGEEPPFLPTLRLKLRKDEPRAFNVEELLSIVPKVKDRYVKGPKTV